MDSPSARVDALLAEMTSAGTLVPSLAAARELLSVARTHSVDVAPEVVVCLARWVVRRHRSDLGDEIWSVLEQLVQSLLHLREVGEAKATYEVLKRQFPKSTRVERLIGMIAEASGETSLAHDIFDSVLEKGSANRLVSRRGVAAELGRSLEDGKEAAVLEVLNEHLSTFADDDKAWIKLAELHMWAGRFKMAAFCWEELILLAPLNPHFHVRLAECLITEGGLDGALAARRHVAHAVRITRGEHLRSVLMLARACHAVAAAASSATSGRRGGAGGGGGAAATGGASATDAASASASTSTSPPASASAAAATLPREENEALLTVALSHARRLLGIGTTAASPASEALLSSLLALGGAAGCKAVPIA